MTRDRADFAAAPHERVTGPFKGYHVASRGCAVAGLRPGFLGQYKICRGHPENFAMADPLMEGSCSQVVSSARRAMRMAEGAAAIRIDALPLNGPNAGWGYGCDSMMPFLREQREARAGEQFLGGPTTLASSFESASAAVPARSPTFRRRID